MRNTYFIVAALVLLCSLVAFGAGVFVQREVQLAPLRAANDFARDLAGVDEPVDPAPAWEEWRYPAARSVSKVSGPSVRLMGELVQPAGHFAVFTTPDSLEQVARFFAEKAAFKDPDEVAQSRWGSGVEGDVFQGANILLDDANLATSEEPQARPVRAKCLLSRTKSYHLTVFLTRAEGEEHTHIVVAYDPKVETRPNPSP